MLRPPQLDVFMPNPAFAHVDAGDTVLYKNHPSDKAWVAFTVHHVGHDTIDGITHQGMLDRNRYLRTGVFHVDDPRLRDQTFVDANFPEENQDSWHGVFTLHPKTLRLIALEERMIALESCDPSANRADPPRPRGRPRKQQPAETAT